MTPQPTDEQRRDEWLKSMANNQFKHLTYCGSRVTIADVERWLRAALNK